MRGIHVVPDERLETVSLVLPVINTLESKVERLSAQVAELKAKAKMADDLAVDNRRLRTRVDTLISNNVLAKQQAQA
jgi:regulator of replication initiation timing